MPGFSQLRGTVSFLDTIFPSAFRPAAFCFWFCIRSFIARLIKRRPYLLQVSLLPLLTVTCPRPSTPGPQSKETVWSRSPVTAHGSVEGQASVSPPYPPTPCPPAVCSFLLAWAPCSPSPSPLLHLPLLPALLMLQRPCFSPTLSSLVRLPLSWFKAIYTAVSPAQTSRLGCRLSVQRPRWDVQRPPPGTCSSSLLTHVSPSS